MSNLQELTIDGASYTINPELEYIQDGHAYCRKCNERKDGKVMEVFGRVMVFRQKCSCDIEKEQKEKEWNHKMEVMGLKKECFPSMTQWEQTFDNYIGNETKAYTIAKNYAKDFEVMKKDNVGLVFIGTVGSGKTFLASAIANELIETKQIRVKLRNFAQIINDLQKGGFDLDRNEYIRNFVSVPLLILDDLGIERDTTYAKEQVYQIVNSRYLEHKPTIFTTNLSLENITNSSESMEYQRIYSRILEMCIPVMVVESDFRKKIHKEKLEAHRKILLGGERE
ncbi:MAG: ATP-binding protein [Peptostreptococcaceae bacterium]|nr:ATP-binding protein [Peptostreptococcaceae bacterium]